MDEIERYNKLMISRELKMIELKNEINMFTNRLGEGDKYIVHIKQDIK